MNSLEKIKNFLAIIRNHKPYFVAFIATIVFAIWLSVILQLRGPYASNVLVDPLAMINTLFPYYWIVLVSFVLICLTAFINKSTPRWLHILLLAQLALILFYTPFLLGGFSWSPDSLWHGGVANYMPAILAGAKYPLTDYAQSYPLSYLISYGVMRIFQVNVENYTLYIFPILCITLISTLAYFFISRITNKSTAFLSMLIALPALHYIEPHVSPFATGTILLLVSFVLLTYQGPKYLMLNILVILALIVTHPISPLFLWIYLFAAILLNFTFRENKHTRIYLLSLLAYLSIFWFIWTYFIAAPNYVGVMSPFSRVMNLEFINNIRNTIQWTAGGQGFIFPEIGQLSLYIYAIFGVLIVLITGWTVVSLLKKRQQIEPVVRTRLQLAIAALGSAIIGYLLFSASGERFLLGRGLLFFLMLGSVCVASYINGIKWKRPKWGLSIIVLFIILLSLSFPIVAYSKEDYNTFTPDSEGVLIYLSQMDLTNKTISMGYDQQLAAYVNLSSGLKLVGFPPDLTIEKPDIFVLRLNYYYLLSMRYEFSFTNNSYTRAQVYLANCTDYKMVYANDQSQIWVKIP